MSLYLKMKDQLLKLILEGKYGIGTVLPTEQQLGIQYEISRVTVRKALDELKREGVITSVQGQGTLVSNRRSGFSSSLDLIALVAPVHNPFFALFMEHFERVAEENGSLVLFKQDFEGKAFNSEELFFRFIKKNIRNVVLWPHTEQIEINLLKRLRAVGMNLVCFDQVLQSEAADVVCLNNHLAVSELYQEIRASYNWNIIFIGFHGMSLPSENLRQQTFSELNGGNQAIYTIPRNGDLDNEVRRLLDRLIIDNKLPAGILCSNGPLGLAVAQYLHFNRIKGCKLAAIDYIPAMVNYPMIACEQPMKEMAKVVFQRLTDQNNQEEHWQATIIELQGKVRRFK